MAAQTAPLDIHWEAPSGCPQVVDVRDRVKKILGTSRHGSPLRAEGKITRVDKRFHLELVVHVGDVVGTRKIDSGSCDDLAGAAAVEIGLLVHSVAVEDEPRTTGKASTTSTLARGAQTSSPAQGAQTSSPARGAQTSSLTQEAETSSAASGKTGESPPPEKSEPSPPPSPPEPTEAERDAEVESAREAEGAPVEPELPRNTHALVQLPLLALGVGPVRTPSIAVGLSLGVEHERWKLHLDALHWQRQSVTASGYAGYGADVDRTGGTLWACHEYRFAWFGLSPCLGAGLERISVSGTGKNVAPSTQHTFAVSASAGVEGRLYLAGWIRLLFSVGGIVELVRPQLLINRLAQLAPDSEGSWATATVYEFAPAALGATIGLEWAL